MFSQSYPNLTASQSSFFSTSTSLPSLYDGSSGTLSQQYSHSTTASDVGSPETFKQNSQLALGQVSRVQALARSVLLAIQHAYQTGNNPIQTAADMATLQQALQLLAAVLRQSGVGALPMRPRDPSNAASQPEADEERLIAEMTSAVQALFEKRKRLEESAGVVASLLGVEKEARK